VKNRIADDALGASPPEGRVEQAGQSAAAKGEGDATQGDGNLVRLGLKLSNPRVEISCTPCRGESAERVLPEVRYLRAGVKKP